MAFGKEPEVKPKSTSPTIHFFVLALSSLQVWLWYGLAVLTFEAKITSNTGDSEVTFDPDAVQTLVSLDPPLDTLVTDVWLPLLSVFISLVSIWASIWKRLNWLACVAVFSGFLASTFLALVYNLQYGWISAICAFCSWFWFRKTF